MLHISLLIKHSTWSTHLQSIGIKRWIRRTQHPWFLLCNWFGSYWSSRTGVRRTQSGLVHRWRRLLYGGFPFRCHSWTKIEQSKLTVRSLHQLLRWMLEDDLSVKQKLSADPCKRDTQEVGADDAYDAQGPFRWMRQRWIYGIMWVYLWSKV